MLAALVFLCLLVANGRLGNTDMPSILDAAMQLCETGSLSAPAPFGATEEFWVRAPNGRYYQAHDLGGQLTCWLPAWIVHRLDPHRPLDSCAPVVRWGVSSTYTLLAALTLWMVYLSLTRFTPARRAIRLTLVMLFCTFFAGYLRLAFDVTGAALGLAVAAYFSLRLVDGGPTPARDLAAAAAGLGLATLYRFSLYPMAILALVLLVLISRACLRWWHAGVAAMVFVAILLPSLVFNATRTGRPFYPPTRLPTFHNTSDIRPEPIHMAKALFGLTFGPNIGLFVMAPFLLFAVPLLFRWRRLPAWLRRFSAVWAPPIACYVLLICMLTAWGGNGGWGPRFLLPVLPICFIAAAGVYVQSGERARCVAIALVILGAMVNVPVLFVNFRAAVSAAPYNVAQGVPWPAIASVNWRAISLETFGPGIDRDRWKRGIVGNEYLVRESAGSRVVPDLPVLTDGLTAGGWTTGFVAAGLAAGIACCAIAWRRTSRLAGGTQFGQFVREPVQPVE